VKNNELLRTELIFIYDVTDANPNGDPNDENRPRMDSDSRRAKVSDVRLKRTIRDYLHVSRGREIFCRQVEKPDGTIQEGKDRADDFYKAVGKQAASVLQKRDLIESELISKCIDVRLFGGTVPVAATKAQEKDSSVTLTGPVQFAMGTSLHTVAPVFLKGTGAFASGQGKQQKTFREEYILPYALIAFYGIVNQEAAKTTKMKPEDAELLYDGIWNGTKNLITRSKIGQCPLLLMAVEYKEPNAYIGRLDRFLKLKRNGTAEEPTEQVRRPDEVTLDLAAVLDTIQQRKEQVERIRIAWDKRLPVNGLTHETGEGGQIKFASDKHNVPLAAFPFV
jgi:CRISPR-associated protein Csh2